MAMIALAAGLSAQVGKPQNLLDANTASDKELVALPHVTPALAKTIIDRRPFSSIKDLDALLKRSDVRNSARSSTDACLWPSISIPRHAMRSF